MKVIVTGHRGYLGPVVCERLTAEGHEIIGIDIGYFDDGMNRNRAPAGRRSDIRCVSERTFDGVDAVVHLAALSNDPLGALDPRLTQEINVEASLRLARLAQEAGVRRFIFSSSCSIYGAAAGYGSQLDETAPFNPVSAYAQSKVDLEKALGELANEAFSPTFLRNATAFGVSPSMRLDLVLNNLTAWAFTTGVVRVLSDGSPWRPLVHVKDIAGAVASVLRTPLSITHNKAYNIGRQDANYQVRSIAEAVAQTVKGARILISGETGGDPRSYRVDFSRAHRELSGFEPRMTLKDGCEELARWCRDHLRSGEKFETRNYIRVKQIQYLVENGRVDEDLRFTDKETGT